MAKKVYTKKAVSSNANWRKEGTRGKARFRTNYSGLLKRMRREKITAMRDSISALCHPVI